MQYSVNLGILLRLGNLLKTGLTRNQQGTKTMKRKTILRQCVNLNPGRSSHIVLIHHPGKNMNHPTVTEVRDYFNDAIQFEVLETGVVTPHRAFIRIRRESAAAPIAARRGRPGAVVTATAGPTDGLLSITLNDDNGDEVDVVDVPVDYVDDPNAPVDTTPSP